MPIFINGVEAHTVVRDMLTSRAEQHALRLGQVGCGVVRGVWRMSIGSVACVCLCMCMHARASYA